MLRGDEDGAWVFSGAGRISRDRDSFMERGKDLVKEVLVGNRYIRYSWTELSERLSRLHSICS